MMSSKKHLQRIRDQASADSAHIKNYLGRLMRNDGLRVEDVADVEQLLFELEQRVNLLIERLE